MCIRDRMDTTRYVIANLILPTSSFETGYTDVLDIAGFSYKPAQYDYLREKYPNKIMMGTENVPRWYEWKACIERDYIAGVFLWTGVDYLGERLSLIHIYRIRSRVHGRRT